MFIIFESSFMLVFILTSARFCAYIPSYRAYQLSALHYVVVVSKLVHSSIVLGGKVNSLEQVGFDLV